MSEYEDKQELAVELAVHWAKTGLRQFSMRDAVNDYMEDVGANQAMTDESIIDRRLPARYLAGSGSRPLTNIPHCCLP